MHIFGDCGGTFVNMEIINPKVLFNGIDNADVAELLLPYATVIVRLKDKEEKAARLFGYLSGGARSDYRARFIIGWRLPEKCQNYDFVWAWLVDSYARVDDPNELIYMAMNARLDEGNLV